MRKLSCFNENATQVAETSSGSNGKSSLAQNLVQCVYPADLRGATCTITVTWTKTPAGQTLNIDIADASGKFLCRVDVKPKSLSKRGSKAIEYHNGKVEVSWDLSSVKLGPGPEPLGGFFITVAFDDERVLSLGDMMSEEASSCKDLFCMTRREHIQGKSIFCAKSRFWDNGPVHDIAIECDSSGPKDPCFEIRIDRKKVMQVRHLVWKFRGNQMILVDGMPVEVLYDVHDWLFGPAGGSAAVFLFQTGQSLEKISALPSLRIIKESDSYCFGFTLVLHAWKIE